MAIASFDAALEADPTCAMTQWGVALSRWGNPFTVGTRSAAQIKNGLAAVERARAIGATTERERAYIDAVANLYADAERRPQRARVEAYRDAMGQLTRPLSGRQRGADLLRAVADGGGGHQRQDLREPAAGGRHPRADVREAAQSSGPRALHHPQLRRARAGAARARRRQALRGHRAVRPARPAHAVAHLHARRAVAAVDRHEHRVRSRRRKHRR